MFNLKKITLPQKDHVFLRKYMAENYTEIKKCIFCKKKLLKIISLINKTSEYSTSYCKNCDFITKSNVENYKTLNSWFKNNWYKKHIITSRKKIIPDFKIYNIFKTLLKKNSKIIDLGCGNGNTVLGFQSKGFDVKGLEPSKGLVNAAKKYTKSIKQGGYEQINKIKGKFDLIIFNDVLQFLISPKNAIDIAIKKLNRKGYLYIKFGPLKSKNIIHFAFFQTLQNILTINTILKNYGKFQISVINYNPVEIILKKEISKKTKFKSSTKNQELKFTILKHINFLSVFFLKYAIIRWGQRKIILNSNTRFLDFPIKIYIKNNIFLLNK